MIALIHNILPPYRVSLFNAISDQSEGEFEVVLVRETHPQRRSWSVPWSDVTFDHRMLPGWSLDRRGQHRDLSMGVGRALREIRPDVVVVAGWDLNASWAAMLWCARRGIPVVAWVESWDASGRHRGRVSTALRRAFLSRSSVALVPGRQAASFVGRLAPDLPTVTMPNSVDADELRRLPDPVPGSTATFIGELSERKGADVVLAGRHRILDHFENLVLAGDGPLRTEAEAIAHEEPRLQVPGFVEDGAMVDLMASSSAVLLPSRSDPWPLVPVEALVAGRPVMLGPGVGSAWDLAQLDSGVVTMDDLSLDTLEASVRAVSTEQVADEVRTRFTPGESAAAFLRAVECARGRR